LTPQSTSLPGYDGLRKSVVDQMLPDQVEIYCSGFFPLPMPVFRNPDVALTLGKARWPA
jgi:hypothetical protein